jgi:hypothetical protein
MPTFMRAKAMIGVAWDVEAGALCVAVDGSDFKTLFREGVKPGHEVGAGLFPDLSGREGCRVAYNLGQREFKHQMPTGFRRCAALLQQVPKPCMLSCVSMRVP